MTINIHAPGMFPAGQEENQAEIQRTEKPKNHIYAANLKLGQNPAGQDPIEQKRGIARQKALKIVKDAWENDKEIERDVLAKRTHYEEMRLQKEEAGEQLDYIHKDEKAYQELYGVKDDSQEQRDLELLKKRQEYQAGVGAPPTREESERLSEIDENPLTEYQEKMLGLNRMSIDTRQKFHEADKAMTDDVRDAKRILLGKLEYHPMVDAQNAADDIMDASNREVMGMLVQEAVSHVDEQQKEAEEKAKEKADREEEKQEFQEEMELKRALQEAMTEQTKEAVERARAKWQRQEAPELEFDEILELAHQYAFFDESQQGLEEMKNKMNLLEADLKGIQVDEEA